MTKITVEFGLDNAAFGPTVADAAQESARLLRVLAEQIETEGLLTLPRSLRDVNGNTVGRADLVGR